MKFEDVIDYLIDDEGGYVNDPVDKGGETKYGISKRSYPNVDIKNLTLQQARDIYKKDFWEAIRADQLPSGINYMVFDMAVNHGHSNASKMLQRVAKVEDDGRIGPKTIEAAKSVDKLDLAIERVMFFISICVKNPSQIKFLRGWVNRAFKVLKRVL